MDWVDMIDGTLEGDPYWTGYWFVRGFGNPGERLLMVIGDEFALTVDGAAGNAMSH